MYHQKKTFELTFRALTVLRNHETLSLIGHLILKSGFKKKAQPFLASKQVFFLMRSFFPQNHRPVHEDSGKDNLQGHNSLRCGVCCCVPWILRCHVHGTESYKFAKCFQVRRCLVINQPRPLLLTVISYRRSLQGKSRLATSRPLTSSKNRAKRASMRLRSNRAGVEVANQSGKKKCTFKKSTKTQCMRELA